MGTLTNIRKLTKTFTASAPSETPKSPANTGKPGEKSPGLMSTITDSLNSSVFIQSNEDFMNFNCTDFLTTNENVLHCMPSDRTPQTSSAVQPSSPAAMPSGDLMSSLLGDSHWLNIRIHYLPLCNHSQKIGNFFPGSGGAGGGLSSLLGLVSRYSGGLIPATLKSEKIDKPYNTTCLQIKPSCGGL
ncbi:unnamed protein product [Trichobilharzia szidati]|nr:unnamed protein product [Trichobilharzia szidati]